MIKSNGEARQRGWQRDRRSRFRWLQWKRWFAWIWIFLWDIFENPWRYRNVFFYQVVTPVAYKRGQQSYAISGSKNFKRREYTTNTPVFDASAAPTEKPILVFKQWRGAVWKEEGCKSWSIVMMFGFLRTDFTWWRIQQGWSLQFVLLADPYCMAVSS